MMQRVLPSLLLLTMFALPARAATKANTIVMHPGDVVYARFETNGKKIKLADASKEKDDRAQVIFSLTREAESLEVKLKVENKFPKDLVYTAVLRSRRLDRESRGEVSPVVGGKLAFETFPPLVDEVTLSDFKLEQ